MPDQAEQGLDQNVDPSLQEVLTVRHEQAIELGSWLASVTPSELSSAAPVPAGPGWPPYARGKSVLQCLQVVLNEAREHHGFCVRDLDRPKRWRLLERLPESFGTVVRLPVPLWAFRAAILMRDVE